ncbi:MAG: sugar phosphate nucleotidyltransferase [Candidatus Latescibacterota bacterium]|nr:sugar phosphate nucleotidyltransferase [Candidatus Latescibacterota bacterium]
MKGVVLAGGLGQRLQPLTRITNKHLLPVYDKPLIYYPIQMLVDAGITDIMLVTGGNYAGDFLRLIGNGEDFGLSRINYAYQKGNGGIAEALGLTRAFVGDDKLVVVLGDNILENGIATGVEAFSQQQEGSRIFLKAVDHPWEYGIAEVDGSRVKGIVEKPQNPTSDLAVIGVYMFPPEVFDIVSGLTPSARGELEITDVNNAYIERGQMEFEMVDGWWLDAGENYEALLQANITVARQAGIEI